jgi:hypothetical protein
MTAFPVDRPGSMLAFQKVMTDWSGFFAAVVEIFTVLYVGYCQDFGNLILIFSLAIPRTR